MLKFTRRTVAVLAATTLLAGPALAQDAPQPLESLAILAPSSAGSGYDQLARAVQQALTDEGLVFTLIDKENPGQRIEVVYRGSVPDQFKDNREIVVTGALDAQGRFIARNDSLITLCPSKFTDAPGDSTPT